MPNLPIRDMMHEIRGHQPDHQARDDISQQDDCLWDVLVFLQDIGGGGQENDKNDVVDEATDEKGERVSPSPCHFDLCLVVRGWLHVRGVRGGCRDANVLRWHDAMRMKQ